MTEVAQAFRDKTAVAGVGLTLGKIPERTSLSLAIEAFKLALDDSGLKREDVDGLITLPFGAAISAQRYFHLSNHSYSGGDGVKSSTC